PAPDARFRLFCASSVQIFGREEHREVFLQQIGVVALGHCGDSPNPGCSDNIHLFPLLGWKLRVPSTPGIPGSDGQRGSGAA
ncbi:unnamed protein product, partial [Gulo gulo]